MDLANAYRILGVSETASFDEVKAQYRKRVKELHPDTSQTTDPKPFILLTAAYSLVTDSLTTSSRQTTEVATDVLDAAHIDERIRTSFSTIQKGYKAFQKRKIASAKEHIRSHIAMAGSSSDLETVVKKDIKNIWVELVDEIEGYVAKLCQRATKDDQDFLFSLFNDLYAARRRYWMSTVYRNPYLWASFSPPLVFAMLLNPPAVAAHHPWILFIPLVLCLVALLIQYWRLNPRRQFMPPRLSLVGIQATLSAVKDTIGIDRTTATSGVAASGAIIGTFIAPGVGTLVGAGVGALFGLLMGENLENIKERVEGQILEELDAGMQQLNDRILTWLERQRTRFVKAARESFAENVQQVGKLLAHRGFSKQLISESPLLLPAPSAAGGVSSGIEMPQGQTQPRLEWIIPIKFSLGVLFLAGSVAFTVIQVWRLSQQPASPVASQTPLFLPGHVSEASSSPATPTETPGTVQQLVVHTDAANIRSGPGLNFPILGTARRGGAFFSNERRGEWYEIIYGNQSAWIHMSTVAQKEKSHAARFPPRARTAGTPDAP